MLLSGICSQFVFNPQTSPPPPLPPHTCICPHQTIFSSIFLSLSWIWQRIVSVIPCGPQEQDDIHDCVCVSVCVCLSCLCVCVCVGGTLTHSKSPEDQGGRAATIWMTSELYRLEKPELTLSTPAVVPVQMGGGLCWDELSTASGRRRRTWKGETRKAADWNMKLL